MTPKNWKRIALALAAAALVLVGYRIGYAQVVLLTTRPMDARFYLLGEEPLADPNRTTFIQATKIWVFKDRASEQCYVVLFAPGGPTMAPAACEAKGGAQ